MHFNLTNFLTITSALAVPFGIGANNRHHPAKMTELKTMQMAPNETALGHAVVSNRCNIPIFLWSVGENISQQNTVQPNHTYSELFRRDPKTGGIAIKITTVRDGLYTSAPQTVFAYNLVENLVWYDLSDVFGDPFMGEFVSLLPSEPAIRWEEGVPPRGSQVRMLDATTDLILTVC
ncbi:hypothetical protein BJX68DRAFT_260365 [Aspergillus pseudodeflectus]|uniref:Bys1 family protein n=1 Tax=Aspergillus pseudodeflectus TaxID=176178 RepID=A0ABR4LAI6_9EURO